MAEQAHVPLTDEALAEIKRKYRRLEATAECNPRFATELAADFRALLAEVEHGRAKDKPTKPGPAGK